MLIAQLITVDYVESKSRRKITIYFCLDSYLTALKTYEKCPREKLETEQRKEKEEKKKFARILLARSRKFDASDFHNFHKIAEAVSTNREKISGSFIIAFIIVKNVGSSKDDEIVVPDESQVRTSLFPRILSHSRLLFFFYRRQ